MGMKPYSEDLRWRVVRAVEGDMPRREAARVFEVSLPTIKRWLKQRRETGALAPKPIPGPAALKRDALLEALPARLAEYADATLEQHCSRWRVRTGGEVSTATMSRAITALAWTHKKTRTASLA
jgi:transposase